MSSGSGGSAVSRSHGGDRFYSPPMRRHQQTLQQQQQQQQQLVQLQRASKSDSSAVAGAAAGGGTSAEAGSRADSDDSVAALSRPLSSRSPSPPVPPPPPPETRLTNLDRFLESVTPFVNASEGQVNVRRRRNPKLQPFYCLGDLWESFTEWSVYGVGVPLLLNGIDQVKQYYVPFLSGIQLYVDPSKPHLRFRTGEESDAESIRETSSGGSSDCEPDKKSKSNKEGLRNQQNIINLDSQRHNKLSTKENSVKSSSGDEAEISSSPGFLLFEFMEKDQPYLRRPLVEKITSLASQSPELTKCRSCDLLPSSWISVAWYPIYRIPMGPTLKDLDASFLTFHYLSTHPGGHSQSNPIGVNARKLYPSSDARSGISLPVFGLASYKLQGSILTPFGPQETEQENSLLQAAAEWLQQLNVTLPDFQFFWNHYPRR